MEDDQRGYSKVDVPEAHIWDVSAGGSSDKPKEGVHGADGDRGEKSGSSFPRGMVDAGKETIRKKKRVILSILLLLVFLCIVFLLWYLSSIFCSGRALVPKDQKSTESPDKNIKSDRKPPQVDKAKSDVNAPSDPKSKLGTGKDQQAPKQTNKSEQTSGSDVNVQTSEQKPLDAAEKQQPSAEEDMAGPSQEGGALGSGEVEMTQHDKPSDGGMQEGGKSVSFAVTPRDSSQFGGSQPVETASPNPMVGMKVTGDLKFVVEDGGSPAPGNVQQREKVEVINGSKVSFYRLDLIPEEKKARIMAEVSNISRCAKLSSNLGDGVSISSDFVNDVNSIRIESLEPDEKTASKQGETPKADAVDNQSVEEAASKDLEKDAKDTEGDKVDGPAENGSGEDKDDGSDYLSSQVYF